MYSLFLKYCFLTLAITISTSELFKTHSQCGCFPYENCRNSHTANCSVEDGNYEELYKQNSASSKSPEECNKWFLEGFKKQLISENGKLKISLLFSSNLNKKVGFDVQLRYQNKCLDISDNSSFYLLDMKHSTEHFNVLGNSTDLCKKSIELLFPYIFSGCYQLYINSAMNLGIIDGCMSRPFLITSPYKKQTLYNLDMIPSATYLGQSEYLKFSYVGEGLKEPKSILIKLYNDNEKPMKLVKEAHLTSELVFTSVFGNFSHGFKPFLTAVTLKKDVDLSLEDCAGSGNRAGKYYLAQMGNCCHVFEHPAGINEGKHNMTYCPCKWEDDMILECTLREIKTGNYCVSVQFVDPRCDITSLWAQKQCIWSFEIEAKGQITPTEIAPYTVNNVYHMVFLYCVFVILIALAVVFTIYYFKKEREEMHTFAFENIVEESLFINEKEEILLLYPRDCERFMTAMTIFRTILKESCRCKVHDAWDEEIFDKVAESIETWSLPLIQNENTKIIVILTECSKIIEDSYIGDNHCATYRDPKALDKVFAQSIKALNEYFGIRFDSYRRVFVVRLNETPVIDFSFNFNRATVYILPHGLQTLVNDLQHGNSTPINKENHSRLKATIHEYQVYKMQHINYLNDILNINNNCKVMKCLKNGITR